MSQYPRIVLSSVYVAWDPGASGVVNTTFVKAGTVVDIPLATSPLGLAYGGPSNLSAVIPPGDWRRSDYSAGTFSKAALSN